MTRGGDKGAGVPMSLSKGHSAEKDATSTTAGRFGALVDQQAFCGQQQAHWSHRWVTQSGFYAACSGKACSCPLPPGETDG